MLSFVKSHQTYGGQYIDGVCLTTDEKPIEGIANGSRLKEVDPEDGSVKRFQFDAESASWVEITSEPGCSGGSGSGGGSGGGDGGSTPGNCAMIQINPPDENGALDVSYNDLAAFLAAGRIPFFIAEGVSDEADTGSHLEIIGIGWLGNLVTDGDGELFNVNFLKCDGYGVYNEFFSAGSADGVLSN